MKESLMKIEGLRQAIEHFKRMPTLHEYKEFAKKNGYPHYSTIQRQTGKTWGEIQAALGLQNADRFTPEYLIQKLREASEHLGERFSQRQYHEWQKRNKDFPTLFTLESKLGSWNKARIAAGLPLSKKQSYPIRYTKEDCREALKQYMQETGEKRVVLQEYEAWRMKKKEEGITYPSGAIIRRRYGFLVTAVEDAGGHYFAHADEEIALNCFLEYINTVVNMKAYNEWAVQNGKYTYSYFNHLGIDTLKVMKKAIDIHFEKELHAIGRHNVTNRG